MEPESVAELEDDFINDIKPYNKPFEPFEKGIEDEADKVLEDIYPEADQFLANDDDFGDTLYFFRWIINFLFVGIPWFFFSLVMVILNVVLNILVNEWWGDANAILIASSVYLFVMTLASWGEVFELPFYLKSLRLFRALAVVTSIQYLFIYAFLAADWAFMLFFEPQSTYENYDFMSMMYNMLVAYMLIYNLHIIPVNAMIFIKECLLEWFPPLLDQDYGDELNYEDYEDVVNPATYERSIQTRTLPDQRNSIADRENREKWGKRRYSQN